MDGEPSRGDWLPAVKKRVAQSEGLSIRMTEMLHFMGERAGLTRNASYTQQCSVQGVIFLADKQSQATRRLT